MLGLFSAASLVVYFVCLAFLPQMDFRVYRMGAQHLFSASLYSSELTVLSRHLLFTYPPLAALLFWPISHFSTYAGQTIWDLVDIFVLTALIAVSLAAARSRRVIRADWRTALILLGPIGFFLYPVRSNLVLGQINLVLVLMIVVDLTMTPSWRGQAPSSRGARGFRCGGQAHAASLHSVLGPLGPVERGTTCGGEFPVGDRGHVRHRSPGLLAVLRRGCLRGQARRQQRAIGQPDAARSNSAIAFRSGLCSFSCVASASCSAAASSWPRWPTGVRQPCSACSCARRPA